ncbi:MAG: tRNA (guanosine(37)-N1)-methyltransferase TrmD [Fimbriimonadaceae bacterium]|nr:tRNA (guanosine(37)-N1)-methyltransferase TrmD [Fimbriimonadaceae bacterium]
MRVSFVTLFPEQVLAALEHGVVARGVRAGLLEWATANPRDFATDRHRTVDDAPYGGGPGMVLIATVVESALKSLNLPKGTPIVLADPAGPRFSQADARRLASSGEVCFVCGHYEGVDERVREALCTEARSIGDFVCTGGELPAALMADAVCRLVPGVLGDPESHEDDSFGGGLLGFPLYTRPETALGIRVPEVLLSGDHAAIAKWRRRERLLRTRTTRPDLFATADLLPGDLGLL